MRVNNGKRKFGGSRKWQGTWVFLILPLGCQMVLIPCSTAVNINCVSEESSDVESEEEESSSESQGEKEESDGSGKTSKTQENSDTENKARDRDDLYLYDKFFPELFEFQVRFLSLCSTHTIFTLEHRLPDP